MDLPSRVSVREWESSSAPYDALLQSGLEADQAVAVLAKVAASISRELPSAQLRITGRMVLARGIAGILRLTPRVELEIVPKFLDTEKHWQNDFFQLALLTRYARLMGFAPVSASVAQASDLSSIVARNLLSMIRANRRAPLRTYMVRRWSDVEIDGDVEPESVFLPSEDGFEQTQATLTRQNRFSRLVDEALVALADEVRDPALAAQLRHSLSEAPRRGQGRVQRLRAPARHRRWQPALDLSYLVGKGFGGSLNAGTLRAPGFYMDTWRAWEDLVTFAARRALGSAGLVRTQVGFQFGSRVRGPIAEDAVTTPDVVVEVPTSTVVVDAKYKGGPDREYRVSNEDLYEALAFMRAAKSTKAVLLYPADAADPPLAVGTTELFEEITVDAMSVVGARVTVQGLSQSGGLSAFAQRVGAWLNAQL